MAKAHYAFLKRKFVIRELHSDSCLARSVRFAKNKPDCRQVTGKALFFKGATLTQQPHVAGVTRGIPTWM